MKGLYSSSRHCRLRGTAAAATTAAGAVLPTFLILTLSFHSVTASSKLPSGDYDNLKSLIINNVTLWDNNYLPSCSNAQIKWERTVVKPSEGSHRTVSTRLSSQKSEIFNNVIIADFVPNRAFVDINQMKLAGVDIEIFTDSGKREFDIEAPSWSPAAESGVVFTSLRPPYESAGAELLLNVHIRYQNFTETGGMCDEFVALDAPKVFVVCENKDKKIGVVEVEPASEPEKLVASVSVGAMNVAGVVELVTFGFAIVGALLIVVASFI